jgi:hypothetical protein
MIRIVVGDQPCNVLIDTGSDLSQFDDSLKDKLGEILGPAYATHGEARGRGNAHVAPSIAIGHLQLRSKQVVCLKGRAASLKELTGYKLDGVLAMDYLKDRIITFDWDRGEFTIASELQDPIDKAAEIPLIMENGCPFIECSINDVPVRACVDTGTIGMISVKANRFKELCNAWKDNGNGRRIGVTKCARFACGPFVHKDCMVFESPFECIGVNYWSRYRLTIDVRRGRMYLWKGNRFAEPDRSECDGALLTIRRPHGEPMITMAVVDGFLAKRYGLQTRDVLIEVDGTSAHPDAIELLKLRWLQRGQKPFTVRVGRNRWDDDPANDSEHLITFPADASTSCLLDK